MTELHHFHPARKGSGSLRPFPIYPLYTQTVILSLDKPIADCFLFRPRKRLEKRRKRSHTNVSNASVIRTSRVSQTPLQTPIPYFHQWVPHGKKALVAIACKTAHVCFHRRKWVHTRLCQQDRTQRLTRRNRGVSDGGWYHYPRSVLRGSETLRGRVSERQTLPLLRLDPVCSRRTQRASGQRCAYARRCPVGVAAPLGCAALFAIW